MRPTRRDSEQGAVLVLAILTMTIVIVFGLSYATTSEYYLEIQRAAHRRAYARSLADGGVEGVYQVLSNNPAYRGSLTVDLGDGKYTFDLSSVTGGVDITVLGTYEGTSVQLLSRAGVTGDVLDIRNTFLVGGNFSMDRSDIVWGGTVAYKGGFSLSRGTARGDRVNVATFDDVDLVTSGFQAVADESHDSDLTLSGGHSGRIWVNGSVTIEGGTKLEGLLMTNGNVNIDGEGGDVSLLADDTAGVLLVLGDLVVDDVDELIVNGTIFVKGSVTINNTAAMKGVGSIVANGNLDLTRSAGSWEYDPAILQAPPSHVTGGPRRVVLEELWRRASTPSGGGDADEGGVKEAGAIEFQP